MRAQVELPPPSGLVSPPPLIPFSLLQHFFTSFGARDRCFLLIFRLWQNALLEKVGLGESWTRGLEAGLGRGDHGARDARTRGTPPALPHGQQVQRTYSFSIGHPPPPTAQRASTGSSAIARPQEMHTHGPLVTTSESKML